MPLPIYTTPVVPTPVVLSQGYLEVGGTLEVSRRDVVNVLNLLPNPSFENDLNHWGTSGGGSVRTRVNTWKRAGDWSVNVVSTGASGGAGSTAGIISNSADNLPVTPGDVLFYGCYLKHNDSVGSGLRLRPVYSDGTTLTNGTQVTLDPGFEGWAYGLQVVPDNVKFVQLQTFWSASAAGQLGDYNMDACILAETQRNLALTYTDGDQRRAKWNGAAHNSQSLGQVDVHTVLAQLNDVTSGLILRSSLLNIDSLDFKIPLDRFSPSQASELQDLAELWRTNTGDDTSPYDKGAVLRDNLFLTYRTDTRTRLFRITSIDYDDYENLSGSAVDAAITLSDYLTQYVAGKSQHAGSLPSEIASKNLSGRQSLPMTNRRFVRDRIPTAQLLNALPDMTPDESFQGQETNVWSPSPWPSGTSLRPAPLREDLEVVSSEALEAFSGIPSESIPPDGTPTDPATTGSLASWGFNDALTPAGEFAPRRYGNYLRLKTDALIAGPINVNLGAGIPWLAGENTGFVARVIFGAIRSTVAGLYQFRITSTPGCRVWFRDNAINTIGYNMFVSNVNTAWVSNLNAATWYPFIAHYSTGLPSAASKFILDWSKPGDSNVFTNIPAANLSPDLFRGLCCIKLTDSMSCTRFLMCHKRWDGKALRIAYPLPFTIFSSFLINGADWPKAAPAGTTITEVSFPTAQDRHVTSNWGSGWTRRPGRRFSDAAPSHSALMTPQASGY